VSHAIGVTSCAPRAGVSTVAFNIAVTANRAGYGPVLLIDADINNPPRLNAEGETPQAGLAEALVGAADPLDCVTAAVGAGFSVMAGRGMRPDIVSSIDRTTFGELIAEYKRHFKLIVLDIPAPSDLNDSMGLASQLDGVLLVIEAERADSRVALRTKQQLLDTNANLLGVVLNKRQQHIPGWLYRRL
jgi:capsular exopolysaccharide synthesis family protein